MIKKVLYIFKHSYYSLFGGIFISTGISIYTSIFQSRPSKDSTFQLFLAAAIIFFIAGVLWTILGFKMEEIFQAVSTAPLDNKAKSKIWDSILERDSTVVYLLLFSSTLLSVMGIILITLS